MPSFIPCESCEENDVSRPAVWRVVLNEKKCEENDITPTGCNFRDWTVCFCDECLYEGDETFSESIGVPEGDDPKDYFTVEDFATNLVQYELVKWNPKYKEYGWEQIEQHIYNYFEYSEWVFDEKIRLACPEPFCFHISTAEFIADEMCGQVLGLYRTKTARGWTPFKVMDKYDWRYLGETTLHTYKDAMNVYLPEQHKEPERDYWIINTEELEEEAPEPDEDPDFDQEEALSDWYVRPTAKVSNELDDYVCDRVNTDAEHQFELLRGK